MGCSDSVSHRELCLSHCCPGSVLFPSLTICFFAGEGQSFLNLSVKVVMIGIWKTTEKYFGKHCFFLLSGYFKINVYLLKEFHVLWTEGLQ